MIHIDRISQLTKPAQFDPEGQQLYQELESMLEYSTPLYTPLVKEILSQVSGPPYQYDQILSVIKSVLSATYPGGNGGCDAFMEFGINTALLQSFIAILNGGLDPSHQIDITSLHLNETAADEAYANFRVWMLSNPLSSDEMALAQDFLQAVQKNLGSSGSSSDFSTALSQMLSDPSFFSGNPQFNPSINPSIADVIESLAQQLGGLVPPLAQINALLQIGYSWTNPQANSDAAQLEQDLLMKIWNSSSMQQVQSWANGIVNRMFSAYPGLDLTGALNLEQACDLSEPPVQAALFQARQWATHLSNPDATKLYQDLMAEIQKNWASGSMADLQNWAQQIIDSGFSTYPGLDLNSALSFESCTQIAPPALQEQLFQTRQWISGLTPNSPDAKFAQSLLTEIESLLASGTPKDLSNWYQSLYPTQGLDDIFMQNYAVDPAVIQMFYQIANQTQAPLSPTPMDTFFASLMQTLNSYSPGSANYQLLGALKNKLLQYGSYPILSQLNAIEVWGKQIENSPLFQAADPSVQQEFSHLLDFNYSIELYARIAYLQNWPEYNPPAYAQFAQDLQKVLIQYYQQASPNPTPQGLQAAIQAAFPNTDFSVEFPGLSPSAIEEVFQVLGVQSPYTYTSLDTAYAEANQALQNTHQQPDQGILQNLIEEIQQAYTTKNVQAILNAIDALKNSATWGQLQPATQAAIESIAQTLQGDSQ